jgi:hypothetical protein
MDDVALILGAYRDVVKLRPFHCVQERRAPFYGRVRRT